MNSRNRLLRYGLSPQWRKGFTVLEVLTVIVIIGFLVGLLLPAVQFARESARRTACLSNLRQLGQAASNHESAHRKLPSLYNGTPATTPQNVHDEFFSFSWRAALLPFADQSQKYAALDFQQWPTDDFNLPLIGANISLFLCPSALCTNETVAEFPSRDSTRDFIGPLGRNDYEIIVAAFPRRQPGEHMLDFSRVEWGCWGRIEYDLATGAITSTRAGRLREISDGLSQTILIGERAGRPDQFVRGKRTNAYVRYDPSSDHQSSLMGAAWALSNHSLWNMLVPGQEINVVNYSGFYGFHTNGVGIVRVDGSTHFLSASTEASIVRAMVTSAARDLAEQQDH